jgi:hypothetical protein
VNRISYIDRSLEDARVVPPIFINPSVHIRFMGKQVLICALALVLFTPLCLDTEKDSPTFAEQRFIEAINEQNQTRVELLAAINSEDYTRIQQAISKYNYTTQKLSASISDLCADKNMGTKYDDTCSQRALLIKCNARDVEATALIMRLMHDPLVTKEECNKLVSLTVEQEECRNLAQTYVPTQQGKEALEKYCEEL